MTYQRGGVSGTLTGSLHAACGKATIRVEDRFSTGIDDLWSAVTHPERLARWIVQVGTYLAGEQPRDWKTRWTELTPAYLELAKDLR